MKLYTVDKAYKSLVHIPAWQQQLLDAEGSFTDAISNVQNAYSKVPIIYRAVKMRCDLLSSVPVVIKKGDKVIENDDLAKTLFPIDFRDLIWNTEAALLGNGKAVIVKLRNRVRVMGL